MVSAEAPAGRGGLTPETCLSKGITPKIYNNYAIYLLCIGTNTMKTPKAPEVMTEPSVVTNGSADGNPKQRIPCVPVELPDTWDCSSSDLDIQFGDFPPRPVGVPKESEYQSKPLARVASTSPKFGQISRKEWRGELY